MVRILIGGGFGPFHNLGDEAILRSAAARLQRLGDVRLTVGVNDPAGAPEIPGCEPALAVAGYLLEGAESSRVPRMKRLVRGVLWRARYLLRAAALCAVAALPPLAPVLARGRLGGVLQPLLGADAVLLVGGGYLNSRWVASALLPSAILALLAGRLRIPLYLTGQGLGPFRTRWHRFLAGVLLRGARLVGVRDYGHDSLRLFRDLGVPGGVVRFLPDDAHGLSGPGGRGGDEDRPRAEPRGRITVGLNWRSQRNDTSAEEAGLIRLVLALARKRGVEARFIPMLLGPRGDAECDTRLAEQLVRAGVPAVVELPGVTGIPGALAGCGVVLSLTYHLVVLALDAGVPAFGFVRGEYSDQKLRPLVTGFGFPQWAVPIGQLTGEGSELLRQVEDALDRGEALRDDLREAAREKSEVLDAAYREMLEDVVRRVRCRRSE